MKLEYNKLKYTRVQRLMNLKIAEAFRTMSSEALCILTGTTPIIIRTEEAVKLYTLKQRTGDLTRAIDLDVE